MSDGDRPDPLVVTCNAKTAPRGNARVAMMMRDSLWVRWPDGSSEMFRRDSGVSVDLHRAGGGRVHDSERRLEPGPWQRAG